MLLWTVAARNLLRRRFRTASIALAAGLASGLVFAATIILQSVEGTLDAGARRLGADIMVVPTGHRMDGRRLLLAGEPSNFYMDEAIAGRIAGLEGVDVATPQLFVSSAKLDCCSAPQVLLVGFDPHTDFTVEPWVRYVHGASQDDAASVIVGANTLYALEGTYMTFFGKLFKMVSSIQPTGMGFLDESIFMSLDDARDMVRVSAERSSQPLTLGADQISSVLVKARSGTDLGALSERIALAAPGTQVIQMPELTASVRRDIRSGLWGITAAAGASWLMTLLAVSLTLSLSANERRREFGLLRAMGATRLHVIGLLLSEALMVTLAGSLVGLVAGWFVSSRYLESAAGGMGPVAFLPPEPAAIGLLGMVCVAAIVVSAAIAAMAPALRSVRLDPFDAIRGGV